MLIAAELPQTVVIMIEKTADVIVMAAMRSLVR